MSMNFYVSMFSFSHVTTWKSQFILFSPLLKKCLVLTDVGKKKENKNMILFPLPYKNIRKEKHVSQGSKSATLSHGFPYASCLFLNEGLVVEAMAKCWRNVRSEHLISSSQDTYRVFFQIEIISEGTHRRDTRPVLSKIRSMAIKDSEIFRLLSIWEEGEALKGSNSRSGLQMPRPQFISAVKTISQMPHSCSQRNSFCVSSLKCFQRATRRSLKIN